MVLQPGAAGGRHADAESLPLRFGQVALGQIGAGGRAGGAAKFALEPGRSRVQPVHQAQALLVFLDRAGVRRRQGHPSLGRQALDRLRERQALGLLQEGDQVAVLAAGEAVIKALLVIDVEGGRFLLGEGRQAGELAALTAQFHRPADDIGQAKARLDLVEESFVEPHVRGIRQGAPCG